MTELTGHPYKLRQIGLRNFKSVAEADVDLGPLTVVVGANSSGKSTLLQAILALAQAFRSNTAENELPLNGDLVQLGTFSDTKNYLETQPDGQIEISFGYTTETTIQVGERGMRLARSLRRLAEATASETGEGLVESYTKLEWHVNLNDPPDKNLSNSGFLQISSMRLKIERVEPESGKRIELLSCSLPNLTTGSSASGESALSGDRTRHPLRERIEASGQVRHWNSEEEYPVDAVQLQGRLPRDLMFSVNKLELLATLWWRKAKGALREEFEVLNKKEGLFRADDERLRVDPFAVASAFSDLVSLDGSKDPDDPDAVINLSEGLQGKSSRKYLDGDWIVILIQRWAPFHRREEDERISIARSMLHLGPTQFVEALCKQLVDEGWNDYACLVSLDTMFVDAVPSRTFRNLESSVRRFFDGGVTCLGPLRSEPRVYYPLYSSRIDLGRKGEYSAAVLHSQAHREVLMPNEQEGELHLLSDALDYWLREFGLAESAHTEGRGRVGIGLTVTPPGLDREVDLTAVGVGVSQVLPVLLLCLLAEPGTLVVLEQPELHLHPRLEQKLADFLLACVRSGRQIVVETHSEHLVNRLRYHIASDPTDDTHDLIKLIFAESDNGITKYRTPEINRYGGVGDNWPAGFLDLSAREAQDLVRESLMKRKRDRPADGD